MAKIRDKFTTPPGGWEYVERSTGARFSAHSWTGLVELVKQHREYKGLPLETMVQDIEDQICLRLDTRWCKPLPGEDYRPVPDKTHGISGEMVRSVNKAVIGFFAGGMKFCDKKESEARAAICRKCPFNKGIGECSCQAAYKMIALMVPADRREPGASVCGACGCSLIAKCVLPMEVIRESQAPGQTFPPWCWQNSQPAVAPGTTG